MPPQEEFHGSDATQRKESHDITSSACKGGRAAPMKPETLVREKLLLDFGWKFHLGHASDPASDFDFGANQRTYAKAGYGIASCAEPDFKDDDWTAINLPHDWAVDLPFVPPVDFSHRGGPARRTRAHGFRPLGREISRDLDRLVP